MLQKMTVSADKFDQSYNDPRKRLDYQDGNYRSACAQVEVVVEGSQNQWSRDFLNIHWGWSAICIGLNLQPYSTIRYIHY